MANQRYTLTSYDPIYVVAEEVRIPEEAVRKTALRWLELNVCKEMCIRDSEEANAL